MRIITSDRFTAMPWKNGGGITLEIAREERDGRLLWRLSIASVTADGPFSAFPGLTRILTVLSGAGLVLRSPEGVIVAEPMQPVRFPGDLPIVGGRIAGDVRDLNMIFDPARIMTSVTRVTGPEEIDDGEPAAFLCLSGILLTESGIVPEGAVAIGSDPVTLPEGASALRITLTPVTAGP